MPSNKAFFGFLLFVQLGRYCSARSETACMTRRKCNKRRKQLGFASLYTGNYPTKGCYSKGGVAYYGTGGSAEERAEDLLAGDKQRIHCDRRAKPRTEKPTRGPTAAPTKPLQVATFEDCIDIQIKFKSGDLMGRDAGFRLSPKTVVKSPPENLPNYPAGSLESESEYAPGPDCVPRGTYTLVVVGKGTYSALVDGEEVLFGSNTWGATQSHEIIVGYEPVMDDVKQAWLDEHNARRKTYHEEKGREYRPLTWSPELAGAASDRVDEILPTCKYSPEANLKVGESVAINNYSGSNGPSLDEVPATILGRWSDAKLDVEYPDARTLTQVMWRGTRYLGCATKSAVNDDGNYCYVSVCRYSRPGNCNVNPGNWLDKTLDDRSPCGEPCPTEGCH